MLDAAGDREGAAAALDSALSLYEEKGNTAAVEVTRRRRSALER